MSPQPQPQVNAARLLRHLSALAEFGKTPAGGVTRVAYSDADREGRAYVIQLMTRAGLQTSIDAAGNIIGRRPGSDSTLPPLVTGSHIDTVTNGGDYDGCVGSISGIEVAQTLLDYEITMVHPLEVIVFQNEEQGLFGSRALIGDLSDVDLDLVSPSGKTIREGINFIGGDASRLDTVRRRPGDISAFLEYHIEQGPVLESNKTNIGIVTGIVGVNRWSVTVTGVANHAGTTPMDKRKDALLSAARFVDTVNRIVTSHPGKQVGTVGQIGVVPGAINVIPGEANLSLELRDLDAGTINLLYQMIVAEAEGIARMNGTAFGFRRVSVQFPALTETRIRAFTLEACQEFAFSSDLIPSGAGHDAQAMSRLAPMGMIFVPSVGGVSHSPLEYSRPADIGNGANMHLHTILKLDKLKS
jgi:beta-ureidopropionase / N-carbamoyl-L-amino-acid hydrolase